MPDPITCPRCGDEMNHHADKLVVPEAAESPDVDPTLGGVVLETHGCVGCGHVEARVAERD